MPVLMFMHMEIVQLNLLQENYVCKLDSWKSQQVQSEYCS